MRSYIQTLVLIFAVLTFAFPASAAVRSLDDYGPVDLAAEMKSAKEKSEAEVSKYDSSGNAIYDEAYMAGEGRMLAMFSYLTNNKWMVTRSMLFGFTNIDAAKQELKDTGAFRMLLEKETGGASPLSIIFAIPEFIVGAVRNAAGGFAVKAALTEERYDEQVDTVVDKVFDIPYMDASSGDTLYKRVRTIGYVLLIVFFVARMACILVKNIITDDRTSEQYGMALEIREVMTYFVILALLMTYTPTLIKFVMWFSDIFRDLLMGGGTKDGVTEVMNSFVTLSYIKGKILGMYKYAEMNLVQMIFSPGVWFRSLITWFCYVLCSAVLFVIVILADVMIGITAILTPFILAISILPMSSSWRVNYYHSLFKFSLYIPLAGLYAIIMCYIHTIIPNISLMPFLCLSFAFFWAACRIPSMAENLSGTVFVPEASKLGGSIAQSPSKLARYGASKLGGKDPK